MIKSAVSMEESGTFVSPPISSIEVFPILSNFLDQSCAFSEHNALIGEK